MRKKTVTRAQDIEQLDARSLAVFTVALSKRGAAKSVDEYIDIRTGEIIPAHQLVIPKVDLRTKLQAREKVLESLRPEVRRFATFVLKFANKRRGITPGIDALCHWFAGISGKRASDVRRYIPALMKAGVLMGDALLGPLFQRTARTAAEVKGEDFGAWIKYARMRSMGFDPLNGEERRAMPMELVAQEVAALDMELEAEEAAYFAIRRAATAASFVLFC